MLRAVERIHWAGMVQYGNTNSLLGSKWEKSIAKLIVERRDNTDQMSAIWKSKERENLAHLFVVKNGLWVRHFYSGT